MFVQHVLEALATVIFVFHASLWIMTVKNEYIKDYFFAVLHDGKLILESDL